VLLLALVAGACWPADGRAAERDDPIVDDVAPILDGGRYVLSTQRGGTPSLGVAVARGLALDGSDELADFTLATNVSFERIQGPAAATVRFRYQPEAGGGTGYLVSVDPFGARARLEVFDEGRREPLTPWTILPRTAAAPMRLALSAIGAEIGVSVDEQEILRVVDDRFRSGRIALGVVTWSEPVTATFDNVAVTVSNSSP